MIKIDMIKVHDRISCNRSHITYFLALSLYRMRSLLVIAEQKEEI